ncbi:hypothetical protein AAC387_Pa11g1212 [Persea americana]
MSNMRPIKTEVDIGRIGREIIGNVKDFVLIGIPFSWRKISIQAVKRGARTSWGNFNATEINITSKWHFAFHFVSQADIDRVVTRGPWVFDGVLMGFQQVKDNQKESLEHNRRKLTSAMMNNYPQLLWKFLADKAKVSLLVEMMLHLKLELYSLERQEQNFGTVVQLIKMHSSNMLKRIH